MNGDAIRTSVERLVARKGRTLKTLGPATVDETTVRRFREALGWQPDPSLGVPPAILMQVFRADTDVRSDSRPRETIDSALTDPVNGGTELLFSRPLRLGEVLTGEVVLTDVALREGKSGPLALVVTETICRDQDGSEVGRTRVTMIYRGARA